MQADPSIWENYLPPDFSYNSIQNTNIVGVAFENSLTSDCCYLQKFGRITGRSNFLRRVKKLLDAYI